MAHPDFKIYVIHENDEWVYPLRKAFRDLNLPFEEWHLSKGSIDLMSEPPKGVFYNRMSASSHTRGHTHAGEFTNAVLAWLERWGRVVVNNSRALALELSKVNQYSELQKHGIRMPRTVAAHGKADLIEAAKKHFADQPFITKHNRGGKGLGVQLFRTIDALSEYVNSDRYEESHDGITLLQQYIEAPEPFITRVEFIGNEFKYAVRVDTSDGFELCPADGCQLKAGAACPADGGNHKFTIVNDFDSDSEQIRKYKSLIAANGINISGIEFIVDKNTGDTYTYDVNTNTNYNMGAERRAGVEKGGMRSIAEYLGQRLQQLYAADASLSPTLNVKSLRTKLAEEGGIHSSVSVVV